MIVMYIVIFLLGMFTGAVLLMVICCILADGMSKKRPLTKEEWKAGYRQK